MMFFFFLCILRYYSTQHLSAKSDVFSYGVVLLEMITGREPLNIHRPRNEWSLVEWVCLNFFLTFFLLLRRTYKNFIHLFIFFLNYLHRCTLKLLPSSENCFEFG